MGREIRRVPANWQHPKNEHGKYIPMVEHITYTAEEIEQGLRDGWLKNTPPNYGMDVMPQWLDSERTHLQMYENTSEGTPISPVMATADELAHWLEDNKASAFGDMTATYAEWLSTIRLGGSVSMVVQNGQIESGVAWQAKHSDK